MKILVRAILSGYDGCGAWLPRSSCFAMRIAAEAMMVIESESQTSVKSLFRPSRSGSLLPHLKRCGGARVLNRTATLWLRRQMDSDIRRFEPVFTATKVLGIVTGAA